MRTYEEEHWARLSPRFRDVHNRLRTLRGLPPIPPPKIDLWLPPRGAKPIAWDPHDDELHRLLADMGAADSIPEAAT
jgi:hypothetical protein